MKRAAIISLLLLLLCFNCCAEVYYYHFPMVNESWGDPTAFNYLSPGIFQIMFRDSGGTVRVATYGIAGREMDSLKNPQLLMLFKFDKALGKLKLIKKY